MILCSNHIDHILNAIVSHIKERTSIGRKIVGRNPVGIGKVLPIEYLRKNYMKGSRLRSGLKEDDRLPVTKRLADQSHMILGE